MKKTMRFIIFTCGLVAAFSVARIQAAEPDPRPNILFALADDWSWPHAGVYADPVVRTPTFDKVAAEGVLFTHICSAAPSCTPSRAAILTGQAPHRLEEGANLWGILPKRYPVYPDLLEAAGYTVGHMGKGWGPGSLEGSGRSRNPAGTQFKNFGEFLRTVPRDKPFCFWYGSRDPHRPYVKGSGLKSGKRLEDVVVPAFLPDAPEVRSDILDYYFAVERYDRDTGEILNLLQESGRAENTIVVMTGDNGWPFPRAKANLYDAGTRQPLAVRWPAKVKGGRKYDDFISFMDFAPTFLEAAGLKPLPEMTGRSFLDLLVTGQSAIKRDRIFVERERHANVRRGDLAYPSRAIRTREFLYIRNLRPDRWPAGDPEFYKAVGAFGDVDGSPSKDLILERRHDPAVRKYFELAFGKRPAEELYDLTKDGAQLYNVAGKQEYAAPQQQLRTELDRWMKENGDPRAAGDDDRWDKFPYFGGPPRLEPKPTGKKP
jgi:uncharacterized sulfatase